jgi:hypothetical protein
MRKHTPDGHRDLAAAILHQAVQEWKNQSNKPLRQFFASDWFDVLADYLDLDPDVVRERIGVT